MPELRLNGKSYGGGSDWIFFAEATGTTGTIALPTNFKELHVMVGLREYMYTFHILADYLTTEPTNFRGGFMLHSNTYGDAYVAVTKTQITAWQVRRENVAKEATVKVYYK